MALSLTNSARKIFEPLLELVYPTLCGGGCGAQGQVLCHSCAKSFVEVDPSVSCPLCGRPVGVRALCGDCILHGKQFLQGHFGYSFEGPLRESLHSFKFRGRKDVGRVLVQMMEGKIRAFAGTFDVILPLPVTEKRLKERGFNQSFIIAEEVSKIAGKPLDYRTLQKVKETKDQFTLSKEERRRNVKGAFRAPEGINQLKGKRLLLVDDLYTTGNTADEACRALLPLRPQGISVFALAHTP
jgi:competence protein ComFC